MRRANIRLITLLTIVILASISTPSLLASPLTVKTGKSSYAPGSEVKVIINGKPNTWYGVEVRDPKGAPVCVTQVRTDSGGKATVTFKLSSNCRTGTYTVYVAGGGESATVKFSVKTGAAAPPGGAAGVSPRSAALGMLSRANSRFRTANETLSTLLDALALLRLQERLANLSELLGEIKGLLDEARAEVDKENYDKARQLASSAYSMAEELLREALEVARSALQEVIGVLRNTTSDEDVLSLLDMAEERLGEVTAARPEESVDAVLASSRIIVAALRLSNATGMEERVAELSRSLNETRSELEAARSMIGELEGRVEELESQLLSMQQQLNATLGELEAAKSRIGELEDENEQLRTRNAELEQRVAELEAALAARTTMLVAAVIAAVALAIVLAYQWLRGRRRG